VLDALKISCWMSSIPDIRTADSKAMIIAIAAQSSALSKVSQVNVDAPFAFALVVTVGFVDRRVSAAIKSVEQQYVTKGAAVIARVKNGYLIPNGLNAVG
jgi:hypothetical protein